MTKYKKTLCIYHEECGRYATTNAMCKMHSLRVYRTGKPTVTKAKAGTGRTPNDSGYIYIWQNGKLVSEHRLLAEKALGKPLPKGVVVHHMNENTSDNYSYFNLIICPDAKYHKLLHIRARLQKEGFPICQ